MNFPKTSLGVFNFPQDGALNIRKTTVKRWTKYSTIISHEKFVNLTMIPNFLLFKEILRCAEFNHLFVLNNVSFAIKHT